MSLESHDRREWRELRRQQRELRRQQCRLQTGPSSIVTGAVLVGIGFVLLLDRLGVIYLRDVFQFWPMLLVAGGIIMMLQPVSLVARTWFAMLVAAGLLLEANNLGYIQLRGELFWPLVLIGLGIVSLIHALESRTHPPNGGEESQARPADFWPGAGFFQSFGRGFVHGSALFSGMQRKVTDQDFRRAHVSAIFGGFDLDLRSAGIQDEEAYVKADAVFGGIEIRVPENWDVVLRASGVFGGVTDETKHPDPNTDPAPKRLIIRGSAVFGGIVVKNNSRSMWS